MRENDNIELFSSKDKIKFYVGNEEIVTKQKRNVKPTKIFSKRICDFIDDLSKQLLKDNIAKKYTDVMTFAFWCRKANILKIRKNYIYDDKLYMTNQHINGEVRVGKGIVFHIAPSNVPINFAFTLVFGMLSGNANIVRVSSKEFDQTNIVCNEINKLLDKEKYRELKEKILIISYKHDEKITNYFSKFCDMRVIWGGDNTINEIRKSPIKSKCFDICFADRYSIAYFDEASIKELTNEKIRELALNFYNDTYLMDQNACSSPMIIFWKNKKIGDNARNRFYSALYEIVLKKYDLADKKVLDKYTDICEIIALYKDIANVKMYDNLLYIVSIYNLPDKIEELRGRFGLFFEMNIDDENNIYEKITDKIQTCIVYGIDKETLLENIISNNIRGIDRIVDVGKAMNIGVWWDGHDVIRELSRILVI